MERAHRERERVRERERGEERREGVVEEGKRTED
jgi:hypothetical protein